MIKVSVILPSLNVESYIRECMESVVKQSLKEIEIICVDAGSNDKTLEIISEYAEKDERIKFIQSDRRSYGKQVNIGIEKALGEYIGIVETDDFVLPEMYEKLYEYAKLTDADVVKSPYIEYCSKTNRQTCYYGEKLNQIFPRNDTFSAKEFGEILAYHASVWAGIYKKEYLKEKNIRFIEAEGAGYVDVGFRIDSCINTEKIAWYPEAYYCYRTNNENSSTNEYRISVMLERWNEVHKKYQSIKNDYDQYYGSYSVFDEYMNTLAYAGYLDFSENDQNLMIDNLSYTKEEIIRNSSVMNAAIKKKLLNFKKDPHEYFRKRNNASKIMVLVKKTGNCLFPKGSPVRSMIKKMVLLKEK